MCCAIRPPKPPCTQQFYVRIIIANRNAYLIPICPEKIPHNAAKEFYPQAQAQQKHHKILLCNTNFNKTIRKFLQIPGVDSVRSQQSATTFCPSAQHQPAHRHNHYVGSAGIFTRKIFDESFACSTTIDSFLLTDHLKHRGCEKKCFHHSYSCSPEIALPSDRYCFKAALYSTPFFGGFPCEV